MVLFLVERFKFKKVNPRLDLNLCKDLPRLKWLFPARTVIFIYNNIFYRLFIQINTMVFEFLDGRLCRVRNSKKALGQFSKIITDLIFKTMNFETACIYGFIYISNNTNPILSVNTQNLCIKPHFQCVLMN